MVVLLHIPRYSTVNDGSPMPDKHWLEVSKLTTSGATVPPSIASRAKAVVKGVQVLSTKKVHEILSGQPAGFSLTYGRKFTQKVSTGGLVSGWVVGGAVVVVGSVDVVGPHPGPTQMVASKGTT
jgi:hypothetical protein